MPIITDTPRQRASTYRGDLFGRIKNLEVRLAANDTEIRQSQCLRYSIFYDEMAAKPDRKTLREKRDIDRFDIHCDHLLVIDRALENELGCGQVVGSYRLLNEQNSKKTNGFYSAAEFNLDSLMRRHKDKKFLEFGRSCVLPPYRNKRTIELLWQGSWAYVRQHKVDIMFGCASFQGCDPDKLAEPLSFLYHHARAQSEWAVKASQNGVCMNRIAANRLDMKSALRALPPLIKGYLRLGAIIGEEAVIDHQFGTIDVMIVLPVAQLNPRYVNYYGKNAERHLPAMG